MAFIHKAALLKVAKWWSREVHALEHKGPLEHEGIKESEPRYLSHRLPHAIYLSSYHI